MNSTLAQLRHMLPCILGLGAYLCTMIMANGPLDGCYDVASLHPRFVQAGRIATCLVVAASVLIARRTPDTLRACVIAAVLIVSPMACSYIPSPAESVIAHADQTS